MKTLTPLKLSTRPTSRPKLPRLLQSKRLLSRAELKINIQIRAKRKRPPLLSQLLLRRKRRTTNVQKDDETDEAVDAVAHVASDDHAV